MHVFITGGLGFIGSELIRQYMMFPEVKVTNFDALTYAGSDAINQEFQDNRRYHFIHANLKNRADVRKAVFSIQPDIIIHLAAETHVDNSIHAPQEFIDTNVVGTYHLLEACKDYLRNNPLRHFRFIHVSTDEVFGGLDFDAPAFTEESQIQPSSPYSASKASSDHLALAWHRTYGLPVIVTHSTNNYGPYQHAEKLIPNTIIKALAEDSIPVYGTGENIRDWIFVADHCRAIRALVERGKIAERYLVGAGNEQRNIDIVRSICRYLDLLQPKQNGATYDEQIDFVADRLGHDLRYAANSSKIAADTGWKAEILFEEGLQKTVAWYVEQHTVSRADYKAI